MVRKGVVAKPYRVNKPQPLRRPVKKAVKRLKMSGLNAKMAIYDERGFIIIPIEEIVNLIKRKVAYKNMKVTYTENKIVVEVWRE